MSKVMKKSTMEVPAAVLEALNQQVANWTVLYTKLHHFHWYLSGEDFFVLHEKFEQLYEEAGQTLDELAERLLALNGRPASSLKESLKLTTLKEAVGGESARQMVEGTLADLTQLVDELAEAIEKASDAGDEPTADMLTALQFKLQHHAWMFRSFLRSGPERKN